MTPLTRRALLRLLTQILVGSAFGKGYSETPDKRVQLGVYDWNRTFLMQDSQTYEHEFIDWVDYTPKTLTPFLREAHSRSRIPLITIEPKVDPRFHKLGLLQDIVDGQYDKTIKLIGHDIAKHKFPVIVRPMHEFDISHNIARYPWVTHDHVLYVATFRHFVDELRKHCTNASLMWSPSGDRSVTDFYPGADYTAQVGCTMFSYPAWDQGYFGYVRTFDQVMSMNYYNLHSFRQPIVVAEFGAARGDAQAAWIRDALLRAPAFPLLKALIYFNAPDTGTWKPELPKPDFSISPDLWRI